MTFFLFSHQTVFVCLFSVSSVLNSVLCHASNNTTSQNIGGTNALAVPHLTFWKGPSPKPPKFPPMVNTYMHEYIYACVCMHVVCVNTCMYECIYVCVYAYIM